MTAGAGYVGLARALWGVVIALGTGGLLFGGCTLDRGGDLQQECTAASECPVTDGSCQEAICEAGFCGVIAKNGDLASQVANDCKLLTCETGVTVALPDPLDVPPANDCVEHVCEGTEVVSTYASAGSICSGGAEGGRCDGNGTCVVNCDEDSDCKDESNPPCQVAYCDFSTGVCAFDPAPDGESPNENQDDCVIHTCAAGVELVVSIDALETCVHGTNPYADLCDGNGACVECLGAEEHCDHLAESDACRSRSCNAGSCELSLTPAGPLAGQTEGDCQEVQCDGAGNTISVADDGDVADDMNDCTLEGCAGGVPTQANAGQGVGCGNGGVCNGNGSCAGCLGSDVSTCGADGTCFDWTCVNETCVADNDPAGTPVNGLNPGDCKKRECNGSGNVVVVADATDLPNDNNDCTNDTCLGTTPVHTQKGTSAACNLMPGSGFCNGAGACVQCNNPGQCPAGDGVCESAACNANACSIAPHSASTPAPVGSQVPGDCKTLLCDGAGEVGTQTQTTATDLPNDGNPCTNDTCSGSTPAHTPRPLGTACPGGHCNGPMAMCVECTQNSHCAAMAPATQCDTSLGDCRRPHGAACSADNQCLGSNCVDDVCCSSACNGACERCNASGACVSQGAGTDPDDECAPPGDVGPDCGGANACACNVDPTPPPASCPASCTGGCNGTVCNIDCTGGGDACANTTVACPAGWECAVDCAANGNCQNVVVACPGTFGCEVSCGANNACVGATIACAAVDGAGTCALDCQGGNPSTCSNVTMSCGDDACTAACPSATSGFTFNPGNACMTSNTCG